MTQLDSLLDRLNELIRGGSAEGVSVQDLSERLGVSDGTVRNYLRRIGAKLVGFRDGVALNGRRTRVPVYGLPGKGLAKKGDRQCVPSRSMR